MVVESCPSTRDVETVIFQLLPLTLPLTKNEKTTVDLSSTKFAILLQSKSVTKDAKVAKMTKRRKNKIKQSKRQQR